MKELNTLTDEILVRYYLEGNNSAFDVLLKRYESLVFSYIIRSVKNKDIAEDIFQDVFVKIVVQLKKGNYSENGKFSSWMMRITHNYLLDYHRSASVKHFDSDTKIDSKVMNNLSYSERNDGEGTLIFNQTANDIKRLIELLPDNQKDVVLMRYFEDLSFKEIAEKTNCSINTALGRMRYALINLHRMAVKNSIDVA